MNLHFPVWVVSYITAVLPLQVILHERELHSYLCRIVLQMFYHCGLFCMRENCTVICVFLCYSCVVIVSYPIWERSVQWYESFYVTAVLPLWAILYERELYSYAGELAIPFSQIFIIFFVITGAGFLGYLLCEKCPDVYDKYWSHLPLFTVLTLLVIIVVEIYLNLAIFHHITVLRVVLSVLLSASGFGLAAGLSYILCLSRERGTTLVLELGMRTTYITNLCATMTYPPTEAQEAKTAAVLCGLLTLIPSFVYVTAARLRRKIHMAKEACVNDKPE